MGKYENILKLYLNYATASKPANGSPPRAPHAAANASAANVNAWKNTWRQMSLGYHSKARTINRGQAADKMPLDNSKSTPKRRWAVKLWVKNEAGQFLAREYSYGTSGSPVTPPDKWYGRYRWYDYKGYVNSHKFRYHQGSMPGSTRKLAIHTRFLTLEELLGHRLVKDSMGIPAKLSPAAKARYGDNIPEFVPDSEIVAGVPDYMLVDGEKVPFEVNGSGFDEERNRVISNDNHGVTTATLRNFPAADGIYVYNDATRNYDRMTSLKDFAFSRDISQDPSDPTRPDPNNPDVREMVTLHMVIEDSPEDTSTGAETLYFDMGLTVTVVYPTDSDGGLVIGDDSLRDIFRHWWEGDRIQTLTGGRATASLSSTPSDEVLALENKEERLLGLYTELGLLDWYDIDRIIPGLTTMVEDSSRNYGRFNRVIFSADADRAELDSRGTQNSLDPVYYYGDDNIAEIQVMSNYKSYFDNIDNFDLTPEEWDLVYVDGETNDALYNELVDAKKKAEALARMQSENPGKTFKPLDSRFENGRVESRASRNELETLLISEYLITPRSITADLFGFQNSRLPSAYAKWMDLGSMNPYLARMTQLDLNPESGNATLLPITKKNASFLPGELNAWEGASSVVPITEKPGNTEPGHVPMQVTDSGVTQPNGRPVKPKFVWHMDDAGPLEAGEITMHDIHQEPVPDILSPAEMTKLKALYPREHRGQLGWHRMGASPSMPENSTWGDEDTFRRVNGDNYEFVIMTKKGFNPYYDIMADGLKYLAAVMPLEYSWRVYLSDCNPMLKDGSDMPTFVIDGDEIDGAGVLFVNGNLVVNTVFAYHGLLMVAGDILVEPAEYNAVNSDGEVVDSEGNVLRSNDSGLWYYIDDNGHRITSHPVKEWRGKLVVQGKVVAGGDITATDGVIEHDILTKPAGVIDLRGSKQAIEDTVGLFMEAAPNQRFVTERLGWTSGGGSTQYELWK